MLHLILMTLWKLFWSGRWMEGYECTFHSFRKVTSTVERKKKTKLNVGESHDKFPTINPQFPSCLNFPHAGTKKDCGMTLAIVQSKNSHSSRGGKKINETIFINLCSRAKDSTMIRKGLFWLLASFTVISDEGSERAVKNLWSHFGIITIYCSWMIFEFFI